MIGAKINPSVTPKMVKMIGVGAAIFGVPSRHTLHLNQKLRSRCFVSAEGQKRDIGTLTWGKSGRLHFRNLRFRAELGKSIKALLRNRIFCPRCGKPMVVRRDGRQQRVYYHCSKYFRPWADNPCSYNRFVPGSWDDLVWDCVYALLKNDVWLTKQDKR